MTAHELLAAISPALANDILEFARAEDKPTYRATLDAVAQARKVRTLFLERQPRVERHKTVLSTLARPGLEAAGATLLRTWLVQKQGALLADFLDSLQIKHEKGVVDDLPKSVPDEALHAAVDKLLGKYPHDVVALYLNAFDHMNAPSWPNLKQLLETDPRLDLLKPSTA